MTVRTRRVPIEDLIRYRMEMSERHRLWGFDCPAVDIDFLVIEYDFEVPRALIEMKYISADIDQSKASLKSLTNLANAAKIPFFIVTYFNDINGIRKYRIEQKNKYAEEIIIEKKDLTEKEYVSLLYKIRGRIIPLSVYEKLDG
jgi:hypothetical protein